MNRKVKSALVIGLVFIICTILYFYCIPNKNILLISNDFLITFIGVILGIGITIITFIYSSTEKIWGQINYQYIKQDNNKSIKKIFKSAFNELIEDVTFIFIIFIFLLIIIFVGFIDVPFIKWTFFISKRNVIEIIKLGLLINSILATIDCVLSLTNILKLALYEDK